MNVHAAFFEKIENSYNLFATTCVLLVKNKAKEKMK